MAAPKKSEAVEPEPRIEVYTAVRPDGTEVTITRNIETGESSAS